MDEQDFLVIQDYQKWRHRFEGTNNRNFIDLNKELQDYDGVKMLLRYQHIQMRDS